MRVSTALLLATTISFSGTKLANATEGGGDAYPNGAEALAIAVIPPPGTYLLNYVNYFTSGRFNDGSGKSLIPGFRVNAVAEIPRVINVTDIKILGANWAQQIFIPLVDVSLSVAGQKGNRAGLGDIIFDPFVLGWTVGNYHIVTGVDIFAPTGSYAVNRVDNLGRNYWTFEPVAAFSYFSFEKGPEFSIKLMYDVNTRNDKTSYQSGSAFHTDFGAGYNFNPITVGLNGYYYKQVQDDKQFGQKVGPDGFRGEIFALGPVVRYQIGHVPINFQWQHEFFARNHPQGDAFWLKAAFKF